MRAYAVDFEGLYPSLIAMAQGALESDSTPLQLKSYDGFGCLYGDTLLLPREFSAFSDLTLNRDLFLHKALAGGVLRSLTRLSQTARNSAAAQALEIFSLRAEVSEIAEQKFPGYRVWANALHERHRRALDAISLPACDAAWLRFESGILGAMRGSPTSELISKLPPALIREVHRLPELVLAPWCMPMLEPTLLDEGLGSSEGGLKRDSSEKTELEGKSSSQIEVIQLEKQKKQDNPISHSFEKLETADEYRGGFRSVDGEDQLGQQKNALDELDLKKVTRGGEAAGSTYRADIADLVRTKGAMQQRPRLARYREYPEWDYEARELKPRYCRLYLEEAVVTDDDSGHRWLSELKQRHASGLETWKHRLSQLVNQRRTQDRQWEGSEVSIDSFIRYWSDVRHSGDGDTRFYSKAFPVVRDFSCLILIDQSYSTDSWVMNRRVLDIERDSLGLVSELLGPLKEPVAIAGTWSETRNHCHFRLYKNFNDPWENWLNQAPRLTPQGYTRLGPSIRHATHLLAQQGGRQKLLILLTDGKPTDYDRYEGRYGIEDIHHACLEAVQQGVQLRALAVEKEAKNYFPHLFGAREYQVLQDPEELPERLFRIYLETLRR